MEGSPWHNCYETLPYYFTIYSSITPRPFLLRNNLLNGVVEILLNHLPEVTPCTNISFQRIPTSSAQEVIFQRKWLGSYEWLFTMSYQGMSHWFGCLNYNILKTYSNLEPDVWRVLWIFQINMLETLKYAKRNADIHFLPALGYSPLLTYTPYF